MFAIFGNQGGLEVFDLAFLTELVAPQGVQDPTSFCYIGVEHDPLTAVTQLGECIAEGLACPVVVEDEPASAINCDNDVEEVLEQTFEIYRRNL